MVAAGAEVAGIVLHCPLFFSSTSLSSTLIYTIASTITITRHSLQCMLVILLFFLTVNFLTLSIFERRLVSVTLLAEEERLVSCEPAPVVPPRLEEGVLLEAEKEKKEEEKKETVEEEVSQVISMEEDGRLGNLLIETATLFLIGRQANVSVSLLPQVILTA